MSSDYIPRLRAELLRADKRRRPVWRPRRLLPVAAAAAAVVAVLAVASLGELRDDRPAGTTVELRAEKAAAETSARILRERFAAAGVDDAQVLVSSFGVTVINGGRDAQALMQAGRLAIYDWEDTLIGGTATRAEAEKRLERHPGARVLAMQDGWFLLEDRPALTNEDLARASVAKDAITGEPVVALDLTRAGQEAFTELTRTLAERGADSALGTDPLETSQHFAIVVDDRIMSLPFVNWREAPDGIPGSAGTHISAGLSRERAERLAIVLNSGPLP